MQNESLINTPFKNFSTLCERLGTPQNNLQIIHIAGTNGKGSVSQMLSAMLQKAGYTVGVFTSPHLITIEERIRINDTLISPTDYVSYAHRVDTLIQALHTESIEISFFERITAIAFLYFKEHPVNFVILEVGLGGRLDATNIISHSVASIITKISIDHQDYLGDTLSSIATEKAGIIKSKGTVITAHQGADIDVIFESIATKQNAKLNWMRPDKLLIDALSLEGTSFTYLGKAYHTNLIGAHQAYNAALALTALETLKVKGTLSITSEQMKEGLQCIHWPGRFEKVSTEPLVFIDGSHNTDSIAALAHTLKNLPKKHTIGIVSIMEDKQVEEMLALIHEQIDIWIVTEADNPRVLPKEKLAKLLSAFNKPVYVASDVEHAITLATEHSRSIGNAQIIGFGSLYMIGAIKGFFSAE